MRELRRRRLKENLYPNFKADTIETLESKLGSQNRDQHGHTGAGPRLRSPRAGSNGRLHQASVPNDGTGGTPLSLPPQGEVMIQGSGLQNCIRYPGVFFIA